VCVSQSNQLKDLQWCAAMCPPGGGRNAVDPRFVSRFNTFSITFPSEAAVHTIYSSILDAHLEFFNDSVREAGRKLTPMTLALYLQVTKALPPTPSKFHYIFNLRDLGRVYEGVCQATTDKVDTPAGLVRLWRNECLRVFHDRLVTGEDRKYLVNQVMKPLVESNFKATHQGDFGRLAVVWRLPVVLGARLARLRRESAVVRGLGGLCHCGAGVQQGAAGLQRVQQGDELGALQGRTGARVPRLPHSAYATGQRTVGGMRWLGQAESDSTGHVCRWLQAVFDHVESWLQ
jgi:hypothetical protein